MVADGISLSDKYAPAPDPTDCKTRNIDDVCLTFESWVMTQRGTRWTPNCGLAKADIQWTKVRPALVEVQNLMTKPTFVSGRIPVAPGGMVWVCQEEAADLVATSRWREMDRRDSDPDFDTAAPFDEDQEPASPQATKRRGRPRKNG